MTLTSIATRYGTALVDVILSPNAEIRPEDAVAQLRAFHAAVNGSPDLRNVIASPAVSIQRKRAVIKRIADALGASRVVRNFLLVLSDHRRAAALSEIIEVFDVLLDERLGYVRAEVRSASEIGRDQRDRLADRLAGIAGRKVRMRFEVDPELIGGLTAKIGSTVYDGSVRGELAGLRARLSSN